MAGNHPPRRHGADPDSPGRPSRDDGAEKARARQAAEALFAPKSPRPVFEQPQADPQVRQRRVLEATPPPAEAAATPEPTTPASIPPPHVARIRIWLKYGMTIAQVAEAYRVPITEIKRLLGKP